MNIDTLRQSRDFQEFMKRIAELRGDAADLIKTETKLIKIGRAQGRLTTIDEITELLDQIEAEQNAEKGDEE